ncbi:hypothetical protein Agub_g1388 [Astrephomene gubernaculifera]|uniref:Enhancer of polycomb-like protein n=1 Tax=Astrephomene gubernaculifera TaxID=47775 RepID=A0AAD3HGS8_9CHLO|nr:hypothetical protein Agub_g1388 [Astrephomene gubernaculifera]
MATRTSFRPRPVDISRQLNIVRDVAELDKTDDLEQAQTQASAAPTEQAPPTGPQKKKKEVKEIPVPEVRIVPGYTREYLPLFRIPETYIRGKGGLGWSREDSCEYDLDNEDEDWLEGFNARGANRLSDERFELMLWRLELANAEANQRLMSEPGYATDWRMLPAAVAAINNMTRDEALSVLRKHVCARDAILLAVYEYWRGKRERWGKPILRRLQAPTNPSDTNPYNVFRPRERVNRPQTRRRRENTQDCLDKMRQMRESMLKSLELTELLTFREARKRDIHRLDVDMQRYQLARHHQPRQQLAAIEAEAAARLQEAQARSKQGESRLSAYLDSAGGLGAPAISYDSPLRRALLRKRRRQEMEGVVNGEAISRLPPPPLPADDEMLILYTPDLGKFMGPAPQQQQQHTSAPSSAPASPGSPVNNGKPSPLVALVPGLDMRCVRPRVSRCGRTMLTRCDPLTLEPHPPAPPPEQQQQQPGSGGEAGGTATTSPPPSPLASRHPMLLSSQRESTPWAAVLDLDLLPEGIADKAALRALRDRRLNADRLNAAMLRQTQQTLHQQAAGGMVGATSVGAAAAAAATAAANAGTSAGGAFLATPAAAQRPPPPPAVPNTGAPAGTLPHVPQAGAPAGTLPHVPAGTPAAAVAAGSTPLPPMPPASGAAGQPPTSGGLAGPSPPPGPPGATPLPPLPPGQAALPAPTAPGSAGGQARKVPKVAGAAPLGGGGGAAAGGAAAAAGGAGGAAAGGAPAVARSPAPGGAALAVKQPAVSGGGALPGAPAAPPHHPGAPPGAAPAPGTASLGAANPAATPGPAGPLAAGLAPSIPAAAAAGTPAPGAAAVPSAAGVMPGPGVGGPMGQLGAGGMTPVGPAGGSGGGAATPIAGGGSVGAVGAAGGAGGGGTVKKMLSTSKAVAGPSSASQLKRGPGRPPKAAKATPNGDAPPPTNTTVPMDML